MSVLLSFFDTDAGLKKTAYRGVQSSHPMATHLGACPRLQQVIDLLVVDF